MLDFLKNGKGKILALFFKDPNKEYYLREIAKILGQEPGYFQGYLKSLVSDEILLDERRANLRYFRLNKNHPLYEELKAIVSKTLGLEYKMKELVGGFDGIQHAFIFGSVAKNTEISGSDIDLMLVGEVDEDLLITKIDVLEDELKREINYHIYRAGEFKEKLEKNSDFLTKILDEPKIILKGTLNEFTNTKIA